MASKTDYEKKLPLKGFQKELLNDRYALWIYYDYEGFDLAFEGTHAEVQEYLDKITVSIHEQVVITPTPVFRAEWSDSQKRWITS